jgi:hypothetical protein
MNFCQDGFGTKIRFFQGKKERCNVKEIAAQTISCGPND